VLQGTNEVTRLVTGIVNVRVSIAVPVAQVADGISEVVPLVALAVVL